MIGREHLDECPKCQDTGICFHYSYRPEAYIATVQWCDCPAAKWTTTRQLAAFQRELAVNPKLLPDICNSIAEQAD